MMRWSTAMTHGLYNEMFSMDRTAINGGLFYGARGVLCRPRLAYSSFELFCYEPAKTNDPLNQKNTVVGLVNYFSATWLRPARVRFVSKKPAGRWSRCRLPSRRKGYGEETDGVIV